MAWYQEANNYSRFETEISSNFNVTTMLKSSLNNTPSMHKRSRVSDLGVWDIELGRIVSSVNIYSIIPL
jgi:hypothetical protein